MFSRFSLKLRERRVVGPAIRCGTGRPSSKRSATATQDGSQDAGRRDACARQNRAGRRTRGVAVRYAEQFGHSVRLTRRTAASELARALRENSHALICDCAAVPGPACRTTQAGARSDATRRAAGSPDADSAAGADRTGPSDVRGHAAGTADRSAARRVIFEPRSARPLGPACARPEASCVPSETKCAMR